MIIKRKDRYQYIQWLDLIRSKKISIITSTVLAFFFMLYSCEASAEGYDFIKEAKLIYRVVACGEGDIPAGINPKTVNDYCSSLTKEFENYKKNFMDKAVPFIAKLRPNGLPKSVLYPFGGNDLLAALITYPDAEEITTISLENAGDPRRLSKASPQQLYNAMINCRKVLKTFLQRRDSSNDDVRAFEKGIIPNQLAFSLTAVSLYGYEPISLKYFRIEPNGKIHYLTLEDIASMENIKAEKLNRSWIDTDISIAFRNMELTFKKKGSGPGPKIIVHRHIAYNLDNKHFSGSGLEKYLESKGKISAMTKGASYLLWMQNFSVFRTYMLKNMAFMISDATGILPRDATAAGFEQITYGKFTGAFLKDNGGTDAVSFRNLWKSQPYRPIPFRYGFSDIYGANHLLITQPKAK